MRLESMRVYAVTARLNESRRNADSRADLIATRGLGNRESVR